MNYFLTQYFVNKIKRNRMNEVNINGKRYDEKMIDRITEDMGVMKEQYMVSQDNERNADVVIDRITDMLNRIESKVDQLIDTLANTKSNE
jgi:ribosomal protein L13